MWKIIFVFLDFTLVQFSAHTLSLQHQRPHLGVADVEFLQKTIYFSHSCIANIGIFTLCE